MMVVGGHVPVLDKLRALLALQAFEVLDISAPPTVWVRSSLFPHPSLG